LLTGVTIVRRGQQRLELIEIVDDQRDLCMINESDPQVVAYSAAGPAVVAVRRVTASQTARTVPLLEHTFDNEEVG
jgi:hypothetical protein